MCALTLTRDTTSSLTPTCTLLIGNSPRIVPCTHALSRWCTSACFMCIYAPRPHVTRLLHSPSCTLIGNPPQIHACMPLSIRPYTSTRNFAHVQLCVGPSFSLPSSSRGPMGHILASLYGLKLRNIYLSIYASSTKSHPLSSSFTIVIGSCLVVYKFKARFAHRYLHLI